MSCEGEGEGEGKEVRWRGSGGGVEGKAFDSKLERSGLILAIPSDLSTKVVQSRRGGIDSR